ncbi:MAG: hypothetical protein IKZ88_08650 [Neisseriaceae bacterium]|nr:hypothetical protein [Neisseriaceae bacterium]
MVTIVGVALHHFRLPENKTYRRVGLRPTKINTTIETLTGWAFLPTNNATGVD